MFKLYQWLMWGYICKDIQEFFKGIFWIFFGSFFGILLEFFENFLKFFKVFWIFWNFLKFFWKLLTFFENFLEIFNKFFPFSQSLLSPCFLPAYAKSPPLLDKGARIQAVPCRPCAQSCLLVRHDMDRVPSLLFSFAFSLSWFPFPAFPLPTTCFLPLSP